MKHESCHLIALDDVELDFFAVADRSQVLLRVVLHDGRLMDKYVLFGVVSAKENRSNANIA